MTIVPLYLPWTSQHHNDVGPYRFLQDIQLFSTRQSLRSISTSRPVKNANNILGHCVLFLCFRSEKNQNLMMEGSKKTFSKKILEPIFGKGNEGAQIKKTFDKLLEKLRRVTK